VTSAPVLSSSRRACFSIASGRFHHGISGKRDRGNGAAASTRQSGPGSVYGSTRLPPTAGQCKAKVRPRCRSRARRSVDLRRAFPEMTGISARNLSVEVGLVLAYSEGQAPDQCSRSATRMGTGRPISTHRPGPGSRLERRIVPCRISTTRRTIESPRPLPS
jgi:hypothetical protein